MYKLQTQLTHFRFNTIQNQGYYNVTWCKLVENDTEKEGVYLTQKEINALINYVASNKLNFSHHMLSFRII